MFQSPDIDECRSNPCENNGTCTDLIDGYNCRCSDGYTGYNCSVGKSRVHKAKDGKYLCNATNYEIENLSARHDGCAQ